MPFAAVRACFPPGPPGHYSINHKAHTTSVSNSGDLALVDPIVLHEVGS